MSEPTDAPRFDAFAIDARIRAAVSALGFETPTPIQNAAIPALLSGKDVLAGARTGSGKTAAFGLPLLHRLREGGQTVRALLLAPTRELALQVTDALRSYAKGLPIRVVTLYGGASYHPQLKALREGVSVVVGTPGRVLDHLDRGSLDLSTVEVLVLDEADEMLRMGFFDDVERVLAATPDEVQICLFSATMPAPIRNIAVRRMKDPVQIQVEDTALHVDHIHQRWIAVPQRFKLEALLRVLASEPEGAALVFARTRAGCAEIADALAARGLAVDALHGDLNQQARERVLNRLRSQKLSVVVATDVAARGIDVEHLTLVVNLDLPEDPEQYVHRIGRTGRAGRAGAAIALVTPREVGRLRRFVRALNAEITEMEVPSDAAIAARGSAGLIAQLDGLTEAELAAGASLLNTMREGREPEDVARAALALLAKDRGLALGEDLDDRPPTWARKKTNVRPDSRSPRDARGARDARGPRPERRGSDQVWVSLFLPAGRGRGVRPGDVVGALAGDLGISSASIGRITILDSKTFVEATPELAEQVAQDRPKVELRGVRVPVTLARPRGGPTGTSGAPRPPRHNGRPTGGPTGGGRPPKRWNRKKK